MSAKMAKTWSLLPKFRVPQVISQEYLKSAIKFQTTNRNMGDYAQTQ